MIFNVTGGGGTSLNFKVVGGTTQPTSPKENTIWVNTSVAIPSWAFSATEPESPVAGMVWFATGRSSTVAFNALRKNTITVYPTAAKQYVSGQWVSVEAKIYQGGEWVDWVTYLYNQGNECWDFSGGFNTYGYRISGSSSSIKAPTLTKNEKSMTISETSKSAYAGAVFHEIPFNVDDFSNITVVYSGKTGDKSPQLGVSKTKATAFVLDAAVMYLPTEGIAEIDISKLSGEYYFVASLAGDYQKSITIHEIYLS